MGCGAVPEASPLCPTPTQSPLSPEHKGLTQAHCYPFMGTGRPWGGLCQGRPPSHVDQLGCGAAHAFPFLKVPG